MPSRATYIFHILFGAFQVTPVILSEAQKQINFILTSVLVEYPPINQQTPFIMAPHVPSARILSIVKSLSTIPSNVAVIGFLGLLLFPTIKTLIGGFISGGGGVDVSKNKKLSVVQNFVTFERLTDSGNSVSISSFHFFNAEIIIMSQYS